MNIKRFVIKSGKEFLERRKNISKQHNIDINMQIEIIDRIHEAWSNMGETIQKEPKIHISERVIGNFMKSIILALSLSLLIIIASVGFNFDSYNIKGSLESCVSIQSTTIRGSGVAISKNIIISCYHVVLNEREVTINNMYKGEVIDYDKANDLCLIRTSEMELKPIRLGTNYNNLDNIYVCGSPLGLYNSVTKGIISYNGRYIDGQTLIQFDAPCYPGNSGGALLNREGLLIGIVNMQVNTNISFAIPISKVKKFIRGIKL